MLYYLRDFLSDISEVYLNSQTLIPFILIIIHDHLLVFKNCWWTSFMVYHILQICSSLMFLPGQILIENFIYKFSFLKIHVSMKTPKD